jgi:hypothetical protein
VIHRPLCAAAAVLVTLPVTLFSVGLVVMQHLRPFHVPLSEVEVTNFVARLKQIADDRDQPPIRRNP